MPALKYHALAASFLVAGLHVGVIVALPVRPNFVSESTLDEQGYQDVAALKNDNIMSDFIRRIATKLGYKVADEGELSGFTTYFSGTNAVQDYHTLEKELMDVPWLQKEDSADLANAWEHSIDELAATQAKEKAAKEKAVKEQAATRAREGAAKEEAATAKAQAIVARVNAKSPQAAPASAVPGPGNRAKPAAANSPRETFPAKQAKGLVREAPQPHQQAAPQKVSAASRGGLAEPTPVAALARRPGMKVARRTHAQTLGPAQRPGTQVTRGIASKAGMPMERRAPAHAKAKFLTNPLAPRFLKAAPPLAAPKATKLAKGKGAHIQNPSDAQPKPALARASADSAARPSSRPRSPKHPNPSSARPRSPKRPRRAQSKSALVRVVSAVRPSPRRAQPKPARSRASAGVEVQREARRQQNAGKDFPLRGADSAF